MIMCTHKHYVFFLETTTELSHYDTARLSCNFISDGVPLFTYLISNILHFWQSLSFYLITGSWLAYMCVVFFLAENIMISWFVLALELSVRLQNTLQSICSDWKMLENQSANLQANSGLKGILSKPIFFVQKKALKFELLLLWILCVQPSRTRKN